MGAVGERSGAKARLLEAANAFANESYGEVSIAQLIGQAGVQPPTLYHHFGDKEGLFVAWAIDALDRLPRPDPAAGRETSLKGELAAFTSALIAPESPDLLQLTRDLNRLEREESRERVLDAVQRALYEPLYAILLRGMAQGQLRQESVHPAAAVFLTGAAALRPGGILAGMGAEASAEWWVDRFLVGFGNMERGL